MTNSTGNRIAVLILHFGTLPAWYELWKRTAQYNSDIDFLVLQDDRPSGTDGNIILIESSLDDVNKMPRMVEQGWQCPTPYKLCDVRPVLAYVYEDLLSPYDYWGWGDLDVLYGDLWSVVGNAFGKSDYIATGRHGESGPLAFLRNNDEVRDLWRQLDMGTIINTRDRHFAADEKDLVVELKASVQCDIAFRECLDDVPARWQNGALTGLSGREYALFHFGSSLKSRQPGIVRATPSILGEISSTGGFEITETYQLVPFAKNPLSVAWRRIRRTARALYRRLQRKRLAAS